MVPAKLQQFFTENPRVALAFSGGCDSSYLLAAAIACGAQVKAYTVNTAFQAAFEIDDARQVIHEVGGDFEIIEADILSQADICANPPDRCYRCKRFIFGTIAAHMVRDGYTVLIDGTNATDDPANRPGFRALRELGVRSPLREADLSKDEIRRLSRAVKLFTGDKPSFSCLATKVKPNVLITGDVLRDVVKREGIKSWKSAS
ncbi:MAG: 7-cyano-7-deazaguanine synthase [Raoultibacter sp.]